MKIRPDELEALRELLTPLDTPEIRETYRAGRFPRADKVKDLDTRYRWDLYYFARGYHVHSNELTSNHIDTALTPNSPSTLTRTRAAHAARVARHADK